MTDAILPDGAMFWHGQQAMHGIEKKAGGAFANPMHVRITGSERVHILTVKILGTLKGPSFRETDQRLPLANDLHNIGCPVSSEFVSIAVLHTGLPHTSYNKARLTPDTLSHQSSTLS